MFSRDGYLWPVIDRVKELELCGKLNEFRHEKRLKKDAYKKFDTMGVVEKLLNAMQRIKFWIYSKIHKMGALEDQELILYFPHGSHLCSLTPSIETIH